MLTRGRFVCHVHCLVHDGVVRSSPCGPHHENFGRNLYHMFVPAYFTSQILFFELWYSCCFEVKCWFHTFPKRCSDISMGVLILLDNQDCLVNSLPIGVLLFKWIRSLQNSQDQFSICSTVSVSPVLSCLLLCSTLPPFFFKKSKFSDHVSFYSWEVSSFFSFNIHSRWFLVKMLRSFKFIILCSLFFSGGFNASFRCWSYPF